MLECWVETNGVVDDAAEDNGSHDREWQFGDDLGPEVGTCLVHVVVDFTQEHRTLIREDEDDVLDSVERDVHSDEEEGALDVLDAGVISASVEEEKDGKDGSEAGSQKLDIGGLGETEEIEEVSLAKKTELVEEPGLDTLLVGSSLIERHDSWSDLTVVVAEGGGVVLVVEELDALLILLLDSVLVNVDGAGSGLLVKLDAFNGHHSHEIIGGVAELGALEADRGEVVNSLVGGVHVDDLTAGQEHKSIKHLENVGVGLMDSGHDSAVLTDGEIAKDFHDRSGSEGIKTSGGLIEEDERGVSDQLDTNGGTLALTTGDTLDEGATDLGVGTLVELEVSDEELDTRHLFGHGSGELQLGGELEALTNSHSLEENIVLLNVGRV